MYQPASHAPAFYSGPSATPPPSDGLVWSPFDAPPPPTTAPSSSSQPFFFPTTTTSTSSSFDPYSASASSSAGGAGSGLFYPSTASSGAAYPAAGAPPYGGIPPTFYGPSASSVAAAAFYEYSQAPPPQQQASFDISPPSSSSDVSPPSSFAASASSSASASVTSASVTSAPKKKKKPLPLDNSTEYFIKVELPFTKELINSVFDAEEVEIFVCNMSTFSIRLKNVRNGEIIAKVPAPGGDLTLFKSSVGKIRLKWRHNKFSVKLRDGTDLTLQGDLQKREYTFVNETGETVALVSQKHSEDRGSNYYSLFLTSEADPHVIFITCACIDWKLSKEGSRHSGSHRSKKEKDNSPSHRRRLRDHLK